MAAMSKTGGRGARDATVTGMGTTLAGAMLTGTIAARALRRRRGTSPAADAWGQGRGGSGDATADATTERPPLEVVEAALDVAERLLDGRERLADGHAHESARVFLRLRRAARAAARARARAVATGAGAWTGATGATGGPRGVGAGTATTGGWGGVDRGRSGRRLRRRDHRGRDRDGGHRRRGKAADLRRGDGGRGVVGGRRPRRGGGVAAEPQPRPPFAERHGAVSVTDGIATAAGVGAAQEQERREPGSGSDGSRRCGGRCSGSRRRCGRCVGDDAPRR